MERVRSNYAMRICSFLDQVYGCFRHVSTANGCQKVEAKRNSHDGSDGR